MLIIVIVLLLLLAILGAAYISTTRSARVASAQNVLSSDADDMITGISKACESVIVDDLNDGFGNLQGLNPGTTQYIHSTYQGVYNAAQTYNIGDIVSYPAPAASPPFTPPNLYVAVAAPGSNAPVLGSTTPWLQTNLGSGHVSGVTSSLIQSWLAERIPTPDGVPTAQPANLAYWPNISQMAVPPGGTAPTSILGTPFESPDGTKMPALGPGYTLAGQNGASLQPGFEQLGGTNGVYVPTLNYSITPPGGGPGTTGTLVAGDADGDGIADCLLFRVPGASYDGLTWYAGVRIIDNNSAVNMSTALSRDNEYTITGGAAAAGGLNYYSLFQTSVGLAELVNANDFPGNFANFNAYRFGVNPTLGPQADAAPGATNPIAPVARGDFQFLTAGDLLYHQLARRVANPGFNGNVTTSTRCQALPLSDEAALAYHFCLVNPETTLSQVPQSVAESLLPFSLSYYKAGAGTTPPQYYRSAPFGSSGTPSTTDVNQWFNDNFNYDGIPADYGTTAGLQPIRPLLVSRNPVSNSITPVYDSNVSNIGEPYEPLGAPGSLGVVGNPYTSPGGTIPGMMLPYGSGPPAAPNTYSHYKGPWNKNATNYQFNDVVVGGDGFTYIFVSTVAGNTSIAPTLINLPPTSAQTPSGQGLYAFWQFQPWTASPVKANVNTATFRELYRAFWSVMAGNPTPATPTTAATPFGNDTDFDADPYWPDTPTSYNVPNPQHQFRSPLRDPTYTTGGTNPTRLSPTNTMLLRAALAAVNVMGLRDSSQNVVSRSVYLNAVIQGTVTPVMARVYSNAPQPFISEVYANSNIATNPDGYVAIELYNPYAQPLVLSNWQIGLVNRSATASNYPKLTFVATSGTPPVSAIAPPSTPMQAQNDPRPDPTKGGAFDYPTPPPGVIILPAHGYALLENYNASGKTVAAGDAVSRPPSASFTPAGGAVGSATTGIWYGPNVPTGATPTPTTPANTCDVYVPGLQLVMQGTTGVTYTLSSPGGEFVLLRPRRVDGIFSASADPLNTFDEGKNTDPNLYDLVPVDSYDFTGLASGSNVAWSYIRAKGAAAANWFRQVFPGRYIVVAPASTLPREGGTGTDVEPAVAWSNPSVITMPNFGRDVATPSYTNNFPPIQIYNLLPPNSTSEISSHWPNPLSCPVTAIPPPTVSGVQEVAINNTSTMVPAGPQQSPFGTFARNGDLMDATFMGAYRISFASDGSEPSEFVELNALPKDCSFADATYSDSTDTADQNIEDVGRFCPIQARPTPTAGWTQPDYYAWTRNLYSYLTVQSPSDTSLPNFDPNMNDAVTFPNGTAPSPVPDPYKYAPANPASAPAIPPPSLVLSSDPTATDQTSQGSAGVDGLVNINTASWKVLSMLPMVTVNEDSANWKADNESLAKAIVAWRITHGPFMSIYDLNSVIDYNSTSAGTNTPPGFQNAEGWLKFTPGTVTGVSSLNGLLSPPDPAFPSISSGGTASGLTDDYQSDFAVLSRISNLITTRSDTFTIYIELQGWQNVGSANAQPMVTRRYAFIVDRSAINGDPGSRFLKTLTVPNN